MDAKWTERADKNLHRMQQMMGRAGVAPPREMDVPTSLGWAHAARRCAFCRLSEECERWLEGAGATDAYREFCPNARFFEQVQELS